MTTHLSSACPDWPGLRGDYRCKHNPPTGRAVRIEFLRGRGILDIYGALWIETQHDGVWFPSNTNLSWTLTDPETGEMIRKGTLYEFHTEIQT